VRTNRLQPVPGILHEISNHLPGKATKPLLHLQVESKGYCNQKLPRQATGSCSACPAYFIGLDLLAWVERMNNAIRAKRVDLDRNEPEENFEETRARFSEWNYTAAC
jgi:hypothetical protein